MTFEYMEPQWEEKYVRMLDAVIEYMDSIGQREVTTINERDIRIIKALVEFYDFEVLDNQDLLEIMDDVKQRVNELDFNDSTIDIDPKLS
jgi:hypothetical protein